MIAFPLNPLRLLNLAVFMRGQVFILPVLYLFYQQNGLRLSDFFYFQGIATFTSLLFYIPAGYLADIISKKKILILSMTFALSRALLWLCFSGYWIVLTGEIAYALSRPFFSGIVDSYMCDYLKTQNHQHKMIQNYGHLNFYMSLSSATSALIGPFFLADFPIKFLILLELVFIFLTILFLFHLPETPITNNAHLTLGQRYLRIFKVCAVMTHKKNLLIPMLSSGIFTATTILLVWCFQPLMLASFIPIILFGVISFFNHASRSIFSWLSPQIERCISLHHLHHLTSACFFLSLIGIIAAFMLHNPYLTTVCLLMVCLATGIQLTYTIFAISYVHSQIGSLNRALVSSLNFMIAAAFSSGLLVVFKECIQLMPIEDALMGYTVLFGLSGILLIKNQLKK